MVHFDEERFVEDAMDPIVARLPRAADVALTFVKARTVVLSGRTLASEETVILPRSFKVVVRRFTSVFVEFGHRIGRAATNKDIGLRKRAIRTEEQQAAIDALRNARGIVPAHPFVGPGVEDAMPTVIAVFAGNA